VGIGLITAAGVTRFLQSLLVDVSALDVATFLATPAILGVIAGAAAYLPARRASLVDPIVALRHE
jgi:ABC-type lipoprotein release transport system permease subunit